MSATRNCSRCTTMLLPVMFYANHAVCKSCHIKIVCIRRKRVKEAKLNAFDIALGVVEIIDPADRDDLYIMQNSRLPEYKVGRSHNPESRAKDLSKCQNFRMMIIHVFKGCGHLESICHQRLKARNITDCDGKEWFNIDLPTVYKIIDGVIAESQLKVTFEPHATMLKTCGV